MGDYPTASVWTAIPQNIISQHWFSGRLRTAVDGYLERAAGIEPASLAWKAKVLPLHNARDISSLEPVIMTIWHGFGTALMIWRLD
jgi:hypothetical protein